MLLFFAILLTALVTVYVVVRTPSFQKFAGRLAASYLSDKLNTTVLLDKIRISDWLRINLQHFTVYDLHEIPILDVTELELGIDKVNLKESVLSFSYLKLQKGSFSLITYEGDSALSLLRLLDPLLGKKAPDQDTSGIPWIFTCRNFHLEGMDFILRNENKMKPSQGMDYNDMEIFDITLDARDIMVLGDSIGANILYLTAQEKSGLYLKNFQGEAIFSQHQLKVNGLHVILNESEIDLDLDFNYDSPKGFLDFIHDVRMHAVLHDCRMNLRDIGYFAPVMFAMDNSITFSGLVDGTVADFSAKDFSFSFGDYTQFSGDVSLKGLPDIYTTLAILDIRRMEAYSGDIGNFSLPGKMKFIPVPEILEKLGVIGIEGNYAGYYNDFKLDAAFETDLGSLNTDLTLSLLPGRNIPVYAGDLKARRLQLGNLLGHPDLGTFDLEAEIQGTGLGREDLDAFTNLWIDNLQYRGHLYDRIVVGGDFTARTFNGRCLVFDEALALSFDGMLDFSQELPRFIYKTDLQTARFFDMNLSDRAPDMELSGVFNANFEGIDPDSFRGNIQLDSISYTENNREFFLEHLDLNRYRDPELGDVISVRSDYIDMDVNGNFSLKFLLPQMWDFILSGDESRNSDTTIWLHDQNIAFNITLKNSTDISSLFLKNLSLSDQASIQGFFNSKEKRLEAEGHLEFVSYAGLWMDQIQYKVSSRDTGTDFEMGAGQFVFNQRAVGDTIDKLGIENVYLKSSLVGDSIDCQIRWDDIVRADSNQGFINGYIKLSEDRRIEAAVTQANAMVNGEQWQIGPGNYLVVDSTYIDFHDLVFAGERESFFVDGRLSEISNDTLRIRFANWSLDNFSPVFSHYSLDVDGQIDGNIGFTYQENAPVIFSNLVIDSLDLNNTLLGQARIKSNWIADQKSFQVNVQIIPPETDEKYKVLLVNGLVYPLDEAQNLDLDIQAQNLKIEVLAPFLKSFSSGMKGLASGQVSLHGTFREPVLTGKLKLQRTEFKIDFLNVTYSLSNEITFSENAISFKDIVVYDEFSNQARCSGSLTHNYFRDMEIDLSVMPEKMLALKLGRYDNDLFYGTAFASGNVRIHGPFNDISLDLDVVTEKGTDVYIPINYSVDVSQSDFIIFTDEKDTLIGADDYRVSVEGLKLNMGIGVRPDANLQIFLPSNMGSIKAKGTGDLDLGVDPRGYLTINGEYVIASGLFTFTLEQLVSKRFEIAQGSKIKWDGDMNSANVNITANYRTKTSLNGLGITMIDPESSNSKVNVIVRIRMTDNLFDPNLKFSILLPNLDQQTQQTVYAVLDTNDMALMNQQAISLLVLNSFTYAGSSGSNPISSAAILTNSLSNMLSSVSNKFDIGINYIPGDAATSEELEVALSTQLFDDRLLIDGNFGVSSDNNTQKTSSIVGDVTIEYKLTPDGRFRVKAFNRTNDISIIENDVPYTQGVGIFYRKDFDNLKDLFSSSKSKKNKE